MLLTMEHACKEEYRVFPNPERIDKVRHSYDIHVICCKSSYYYYKKSYDTGSLLLSFTYEMNYCMVPQPVINWKIQGLGSS